VETCGSRRPEWLAARYSPAAAYAWRRDSQARALATFSWITSGVVWVTIFLNLTTLHRYGVIWEHVRQTYGLVQRMLFGAWFGWSRRVGRVAL
jgi:hypothetical protein